MEKCSHGRGGWVVKQNWRNIVAPATAAVNKYIVESNTGDEQEEDMKTLGKDTIRVENNEPLFVFRRSERIERAPCPIYFFFLFSLRLTFMGTRYGSFYSFLQCCITALQSRRWDHRYLPA